MITNPGIKTILIGEDDPDDQELLKEVFSSIESSYSLIFTSNGLQLLSYLKSSIDKQLPGLIILDYNMPGLNGAEILKELSNNEYKDIPKIIWSTSGSETYKNICLELGASDYIVKPSRISDLVEVGRYMFSFYKDN
jgi:CheY-like chemotaxis protein